MGVSQISVFAESKPGHLYRVLTLFEHIGVNVRGYSASDTGEYGIVRFVVDDPDKALSSLRNEGFACVLSTVLCLRLEDKPGELARVMGILASCDINVSYSYSLISTYIVLSVPDCTCAEEILGSEPVEIINQCDIAL